MNQSLFRVSLKAVIRDDMGHVLVVREKNNPNWNFPGGGMDHGETFAAAMKRELYEEVGYEGEFTMRILAAEEAKALYDRKEPMWQLRLIYEVQTENNNFSVGEHSHEVKFLDPLELKNSEIDAERVLYTYCI